MRILVATDQWYPDLFGGVARVATETACRLAQSGHEAKTGARDDYRDWILATAEQVFVLFDRRFRALWNGRHASETFAPGLFAGGAGPAALKDAQDAYMRRSAGRHLGDLVQVVEEWVEGGLAHVEDLESITNPDLRAECEKRALKLARTLMVEGAGFTDIKAVSDAARALQRETVK